ncbi:MAG: A/G-specific adenine glycosylase [Tepidisphaeraceae bacterium]
MPRLPSISLANNSPSPGIPGEGRGEGRSREQATAPHPNPLPAYRERELETDNFRHTLLAWYDRDRRDLPWRVPLGSPAGVRPDPYHVLVSEAMLQQTQVATVIPYFKRFLDAFPTVQHLAGADEQRVLRLWQGLGYYSRARNLRKAARAIVDDHAGRIPSDVSTLLTLPGVGRYTAGAIASIAHDTRAPIVDGNVVRVICRIDAIQSDPHDKAVVTLLWDRAAELVPPDRPGDFNSALMELGATICTPKNPNCLICPVARLCKANERGIQNLIPPPKKAKQAPLEQRTVWCIWRDVDGVRQFRFEQRPSTGRWAGMWQFVTRPRFGKTPRGARSLGTVAHALTHRRYEFDVLLLPESAVASAAKLDARESTPAQWLTLEASEALPLPKPHVQIRLMLQAPANG